jgi:hypothetical protein
MKYKFIERTDRQYKWEMYRGPQSLDSHEVWTWCREVFGPLGGEWESLGGWLKLRSDEELVMFKLRWPNET